MSNNQTPKARTLAARPGAYSERVESNGATFTRIIWRGTVIGQAVTPNKAWEVAAGYVERQDRLRAVAEAPVTAERPTARPMVPVKVKQARRTKNKLARASRKRNRAA